MQGAFQFAQRPCKTRATRALMLTPSLPEEPS